MDQEIGHRLKAIRTRLGFSQRHLARVSGVANATISQIEAARLNGRFRGSRPHLLSRRGAYRDR
jgi:transcriptional regulator with XRE-family HTH domain